MVIEPQSKSSELRTIRALAVEEKCALTVLPLLGVTGGPGDGSQPKRQPQRIGMNAFKTPPLVVDCESFIGRDYALAAETGKGKIKVWQPRLKASSFTGGQMIRFDTWSIPTALFRRVTRGRLSRTTLPSSLGSQTGRQWLKSDSTNGLNGNDHKQRQQSLRIEFSCATYFRTNFDLRKLSRQAPNAPMGV